MMKGTATSILLFKKITPATVTNTENKETIANNFNSNGLIKTNWFKVWHLAKFLKILQKNAVYLKLKISKQGKVTILVIATGLDDVKPIIPS